MLHLKRVRCEPELHISDGGRFHLETGAEPLKWHECSTSLEILASVWKHKAKKSLYDASIMLLAQLC